MSTPEPIATTTTEATDGSVLFQPQREVRFAVVMYGGVSLAIYINGIAQELLNLVRATAPKAANEPGSSRSLVTDKQLAGAGKVYRLMGQYIKDGDDDLEWASKVEPSALPIQTRFVVDVISGTSAGGINGVFLAKALARNQTMNGLKTLWLTEGDLGKLLNDAKADDYSADLGFAVQKPEASLLNSQRMYRKLLEALKKMGESGGSTGDSPLVSELDLFVTTTDIEGIPLPVQLADDVVYERRYRNVFHIRYATEGATGNKRDDFKKENDPFLAFAARCTSSFPFAFDAMQLGDIKTILDCYRDYENDDPAESADPNERGRWDDFFKDYMRLGLFDIDKKARGEEPTGLSGTADEATSKLREAFRTRSFGDGGYLDNKPFSYATSMLSRRHADCAVNRKLLYVEPTPDHPQLAPRIPGPRPDFAKNVRAAVIDLPRQETIREDIDRISERNEMLERISTYATCVDKDMALHKSSAMKHKEFARAGLKQMIKQYGVSYGAYHRLKLEEITTLLAELIARAAGHDPKSDATTAIRELVAAWRRSRYQALRQTGSKSGARRKKTENQFLLNFDIRYDLRRLSFLNRRINQLAPLDQDAQDLLEASLSRIKKWPKGLSVHDLVQNHGAEFQEELNRIKRDEVAPAAKNARSAEERLLKRDSPSGKRLI